MENWSSAVEEIKASKTDPPSFDSVFANLDYKIVMISLKDIAKTCAQHLLATGQSLPHGSGTGPYVFNIHGPHEYSVNDLGSALEQLMEKPLGVKAIEPQQLLPYFKAGLPSPQLEETAEMILAMAPGGVLGKDMENGDKNISKGQVELVDALRNFVTGEASRELSGAF